MKKIIILLLSFILLLTFNCKQDQKQFKAAFIYVGSAADGGWTMAHDNARKQLEKEFPGIKTDYIENVPEGAETERVITNFAQKKYDVIFTTSFGFMDITINAA